MLQAQTLAAASPTPSTISSILTTPPTTCKQKEQKPKTSFLPRNCFTPESKKKGPDETVKELKQTVKMLQAAMEKMKKDYGLQIKQKDDLIREISLKGVTRDVMKASSRPKESIAGELKSPSSRFCQQQLEIKSKASRI